MMNNGNLRGATGVFYDRSLRELYKTGLQLTQQNRRMLQVLRASLQPGSDERATVAREIRRCIRVERAAQNVIGGPVGTVDDMLIGISELNLALMAVQVSPDADRYGPRYTVGSFLAKFSNEARTFGAIDCCHLIQESRPA